MDPRAELLLDEFQTMPADQPLDFKRWRERFQSVFRENMDEESRIVLLQVYTVMLDTMERAIANDGRDLAPFLEARATDWKALCLEEASQRSESEHFHPHVLSEIVQREVNAGRMAPNEWTEFVSDADRVLAAAAKSEKLKGGFFQRLFGSRSS